MRGLFSWKHFASETTNHDKKSFPFTFSLTNLKHTKPRHIYDGFNDINLYMSNDWEKGYSDEDHIQKVTPSKEMPHETVTRSIFPFSFSVPADLPLGTVR